ncbi:MAG: polymorphic toxin-type HINT domain-containing protein [Thermoguttaceae bacterium]|jgi:hypothetical protein
MRTHEPTFVAEWGSRTGLGADKAAPVSRLRRDLPGMQRSRWWLIAGLLLAAVFAGRAYWGATSLPAVAQPSQAAAQGDAPASQPIETIRVGQRVVAWMAGNSAAEAAADTQVDPSSWRLLRLRAEDRWADGTLDVVRIETLQGPEWIAAHRATVGARVPLPLDLQEMGLPGSLRAVVTANEPCPPVASGPGRVVLTTVNHLNASVLELTLVDGRGRQERLRPTGSHKFFSDDRREFVAAEELREGEHLQGIGGRLTLLRADRLPGVHRVYNMTVEGEHVYRVSLLGALVHNNCPPTDALTASVRQAATVLKPKTAYIGYVTPGGEVGFIEASTAMPGHQAALQAGLIPQGSRGFSIVTNAEGQVSSMMTASSLNKGLPGYVLPDATQSAISWGLPLAPGAPIGQ